MAITPRAVGAWAVSNATTQTVTLPTHVAGDMLILRTIRKPFTSPDNTVCNTSGWTAVATGVANGATANGNGTGSMGFKAFYKIATSAAETNPVVTWGTTSAPGAAVAVSYQKASTEAWVTPAGNGGGDATARTSQTSTIASHISVVANDLVDFFRGQCDDGTLTVPTITQTGVTYDTVTEYPATALTDTTSNDIAADGGYRTATAGPSSAAAVITGTSNVSEEHGAWMTRLRVNQEITLGLLDASPALYAPSVTFPIQALTIPFLEGGTAYSAVILADSPLGYWRLGEPSGTTADDLGSGNHDGTYVNTPTLGATGIPGGSGDTAVTLNGTTQLVEATTYTTIPTPPLSLECWVKFAGSPTDTSLGGWFSSAGVLACQLYLSSGTNVRIGTEQGNANANCTNLLDGNWHHLVGTIDGTNGNARLYYDGSLVAGPSAVTFNGGASAHPFWIGRYWDASTSVNGTLDEWAVYPTALSAGQVLAHYTAGATAVATGAELYAPTLVIGSAQITVPLLDAAPALYAPTLAPQPVTLTLGTIDAANAVYAPTLVTVSTLTLGLIDSGSALYAPTLAQAQFVTVPLIDAANAVYAPALTVGAVTVTLGLLDAGPALYAPTVTGVSGTGELILPTIDAGNALYAPTFTVGSVSLTIPALDAGRALYAPSITVGSVGLTIPALDSTPDLYAPTVTAVTPVVLDLLVSVPALYAPTFTVTSVTVELAFLDAGADLYPPTLVTLYPGLSDDLTAGVVIDPITSAGVVIDDGDASVIIEPGELEVTVS